MRCTHICTKTTQARKRNNKQQPRHESTMTKFWLHLTKYCTCHNMAHLSYARDNTTFTFHNVDVACPASQRALPRHVIMGRRAPCRHELPTGPPPPPRPSLSPPAWAPRQPTGGASACHYGSSGALAARPPPPPPPPRLIGCTARHVENH